MLYLPLQLNLYTVYKRTKRRIEGCVGCSFEICGFIKFIDVNCLWMYILRLLVVML